MLAGDATRLPLLPGERQRGKGIRVASTGTGSAFRRRESKRRGQLLLALRLHSNSGVWGEGAGDLGAGVGSNDN